jgi:hypothetical protein
LQVLFVSEQSGESWAEAWWSFSRFQHWHLCVVNVEEALNWPEKHRVTLLIVDQAECRGAHELSACYPSVVRVLTVPDCRDELLLAQFPDFHLFCLYPLVVNQLPALLEIVEDVRALPVPVAIRQQLLAQLQIPVFPPVLQQLHTLLADPDASMADVEKLLAQDLALCAQVLRLANSAYMGFNLETASLEQALNRIGLNLVYALLLVVESQQQQFSEAEHSATMRLASRCQVAAQLLALPTADIERCFVVGLLLGLSTSILQHGQPAQADLSHRRAVAAMLAKLWRFGTLAQVLLDPVDTAEPSAALAIWLAEQSTAPEATALAPLWQQLP